MLAIGMTVHKHQLRMHLAMNHQQLILLMDMHHRKQLGKQRYLQHQQMRLLQYQLLLQ